MDGDGHTITWNNVFSSSYAGLFPLLYGTNSKLDSQTMGTLPVTGPAVVQNMNLKGNIKGNTSYAGAIAALIGMSNAKDSDDARNSNLGVTIQNIQSSTSIYLYSSKYIGGLVGYGKFDGIETNVPLTFQNIVIQASDKFDAINKNPSQTDLEAFYKNPTWNSKTGDCAVLESFRGTTAIGGLIGAIQTTSQAAERKDKTSGMDISVTGYYFNGIIQNSASGGTSHQYAGGMIGEIHSTDSFKQAKQLAPYSNYQINFETTNLDVRYGYVKGTIKNANTAGGYMSSVTGVKATLNNLKYAGTLNAYNNTAGIIGTAAGSYKAQNIYIEANAKINSSYKGAYAGYIFSDTTNAWIDLKA